MMCRFIAACLYAFASFNSFYIEMLKIFLSKMFFDIVFSGDTVDKFIKYKLFFCFSFQKICCRWHMQKCFVNCKVLHK